MCDTCTTLVVCKADIHNNARVKNSSYKAPFIKINIKCNYAQSLLTKYIIL